MKKFMYWLMGETSGRVLEGTWNWLWGISEEAVESIEVLIQDYEQAKQQYERKLRELQRWERQAIVLENDGNEAAARSARLKASQIEQILPAHEELVRQAERSLYEVKERLDRERMKLKVPHPNQQTTNDRSEVSEALTVPVTLPVQINSEVNEALAVTALVQNQFLSGSNYD